MVKGNWMTIDPGFNTGVAIWKKKKLIELALIKDVKDVNIKRDIGCRVNYMKDKLYEFLDIYNPQLVIVEGVYLFGDAPRSKAASRRGDLFKLAYITGAYTAIAGNYTDLVLIQEAREWKGQLPDAVVKARVTEFFPQYTERTQHELDALGIGLNYMDML